MRVVGVTKAFEQKRCGEEFTKLWLEIQNFANKHSISLVIPSQDMTTVNIIFFKQFKSTHKYCFTGSKRKKTVPNSFENFYLTTSFESAANVNDANCSVEKF